MNTNLITFDEFMARCTACGGNWTMMFLTGIEDCWPEVYKSMPSWTYAFEDVCFIVNALCTDKDTTWCGVHVNKYRGFEFPAHRITVTDKGFLFETESDELQHLNLDDWYCHECGIDPYVIRAFKDQLRRENNIKACSNIIWNLCHKWHEGNETGLYLDNHAIYEWLLEQDDFVNEAQDAMDRECLENICTHWFEDRVLELPWNMIELKY